MTINPCEICNSIPEVVIIDDHRVDGKPEFMINHVCKIADRIVKELNDKDN